DIYKNPRGGRCKAVARICDASGVDTIIPFASISISKKGYTREETQYSDSTGESLSGKIISNQIDSQMSASIKSSAETSKKQKEVKRDSTSLVLTTVVALLAICLAFFVIVKFSLNGRL